TPAVLTGADLTRAKGSVIVFLIAALLVVALGVSLNASKLLCFAWGRGTCRADRHGSCDHDRHACGCGFQYAFVWGISRRNCQRQHYECRNRGVDLDRRSRLARIFIL